MCLRLMWCSRGGEKEKGLACPQQCVREERSQWGAGGEMQRCGMGGRRRRRKKKASDN